MKNMMLFEFNVIQCTCRNSATCSDRMLKGLQLIQKRCNELMDDPDSLELALEEPPSADPRASDPYNRVS